MYSKDERYILIGLINEAKINQEINLSEYNHDYLSLVKFDFTKELGYSWHGECNSPYSYRPVFPLVNSNYVKFFKTLKGAKRNFIKQYLKEV